MASFPFLSTGAVSQYPSSRSLEFSTGVARFVDGTEQRYRKMRQPVRRWLLRLSEATPEEVGAIEEFFISQQGQMGSFSFTDPWDGTVYPDCSFDEDELPSVFTAENRSAVAVAIRNNQA